MAGSSGRNGGERLMAFLEDQEMGNRVSYGSVVAPYQGPLNPPLRGWTVDFVSVGRLEGLTSTCRAVLLEGPEEDLILRLNNGEKETVDLSALAAAVKMVPRQICACCGAAKSPTTSLSQCAACKTVLYCSRACQVRHWKLGHKGACKAAVQAAKGGSG